MAKMEFLVFFSILRVFRIHVNYITLQLFSGEKENSKREEKIVWENGKEEDE